MMRIAQDQAKSMYTNAAHWEPTGITGQGAQLVHYGCATNPTMHTMACVTSIEFPGTGRTRCAVCGERITL